MTLYTKQLYKNLIESNPGQVMPTIPIDDEASIQWNDEASYTSR